MELPDPQVAQRVERLLGKTPISAHEVSGGYSNVYRRILYFEDGSSCFVKVAVTSRTAAFLCAEYAKVYARLRRPFIAECLGWEDDAEMPILLLEDLSGAHWPPPWSAPQVDAVLETINAMHALPVDQVAFNEPPETSVWSVESGFRTWEEIARSPGPFLSLGLASDSWLERSIGALIDAGGGVNRDGGDFCHFDLRSDNLCIGANRVVVVDWNWASRGNGQLDVAFWLPSLYAEGGPAPETIVPDGTYAAVVSGYFAANAGLPPIPAAPRVREVQLRQLRAALPWAVRTLGLSPLDGPRAP